jgi:anti-anti-sigma factor
VAALNDLASPATAVVSLPGEIDVINAAEVLALIAAALAPGVAVVIADLPATRFCDPAALRHLLLAHRQVVRAGARLRLAIPHAGRSAGWSS